MEFKAQLRRSGLKQKAAFFAECRPVVYTQFNVDGAYIGYNTNVCIEESEGAPKLFFRQHKLVPKAPFDPSLYGEARKYFTDPELLDVVRNATNLENINCDDDFKAFDTRLFPTCLRNWRRKPWFLLLNQFVNSVTQPDNLVHRAQNYEF